MSWSVKPWKQAPHKLVTIVGFAIFAGIFGGYFLRSPLLAVAGFAIILGSTAEFWLGSSYRIDEKGATSRTFTSLSAMEWAEVQRVIVGPDYVKLSPLAEAGRLDPFRGILLKTDAENREQVLEAIKARCREDVRFLEV